MLTWFFLQRYIKRQQSFLQTVGYTTKRQYTKSFHQKGSNWFHKPLNIQQRDSIQIFFPHWLWTLPPLFTFVRLSSATLQTMFVNVHPKIEFENCITVSFNLFLVEHKGKPTSRRRRIFCGWLGGFCFFERRVLNVRKARKSKNNNVRRKKEKLNYTSSLKML